MKKIKYILIILCFLLLGCSAVNQHITESSLFNKIHSLKYNAFIGEEYIGDVYFVLDKSSSGYLVKEIKEYNGKFLKNIDETILNEKTYYFDKDFNLYEFTEKEEIDGDLTFEYSQKLVEKDKYLEVSVIEEDGDKGEVFILPKSSIKPYIYKSRIFDIIENKTLNKDEYYFHLDTFSTIGYYKVSDIEKICIDILGDRDAYKLSFDGYFGESIWIEKDTKLLVKIEENYGSDFTIVSKLSEIKYKKKEEE